jgi:hypothetical protein
MTDVAPGVMVPEGRTRYAVLATALSSSQPLDEHAAVTVPVSEVDAWSPRDPSARAPDDKAHSQSRSRTSGPTVPVRRSLLLGFTLGDVRAAMLTLGTVSTTTCVK